MASDTEHELWAGQLIMSCCLSSPISTDCLISKKKKSISLLLMCHCFWGEPLKDLTVVCNSTRERVWYKMWGASIQLKLWLFYIDLAWNLPDIHQKFHRVCNNHQQLPESYEKSKACCEKGNQRRWVSSMGGSRVCMSIPWFSWHPKQPL